MTRGPLALASRYAARPAEHGRKGHMPSRSEARVGNFTSFAAYSSPLSPASLFAICWLILLYTGTQATQSSLYRTFCLTYRRSEIYICHLNGCIR